MKKIHVSLVVFFILCVHELCAQIPGGICNWDNNKKAAVVLTFDDWTPGQGPIAVPELKKRNLTATFFIMNTTASHSWNQIRTAAINGNEIANHTKTHPHLKSKTSADWSDEIRGMQNLINLNVTNQSVTTFAYPFGEYNSSIIDSVKASHIAARGVQSQMNYTYNFVSTVNDYYRIPTYYMGPEINIALFESQLNKIMHGGGLLTFMYHSVDDDADSHGDTWFAQVKQSELQKQFDALSAIKDVVWVTTFSRAIKYHKEKMCATLKQTQAPDGSSWKLVLSDTLSDNSVYNQPLSIQLKMNGVLYKTVMQNGTAVPVDLIRNDSILFHAIPDAGEIVLIH